MHATSSSTNQLRALLLDESSQGPLNLVEVVCLLCRASGRAPGCSRWVSKPKETFCLAAYANSLASHLNEEA
jgi:hypothetical protein